MNATTLESYFIEDYKHQKDENAELKARLAAFEANAANHEYGISDLQHKTEAVKGGVISSYYVRNRLRDGDVKKETVESWLLLDDDALFEEVKNKSVDYNTVLKWEEHEFQYTLFVKESRVEWVAVCDGNRGSNLQTINEGQFDENEWFAIDRKDEFKAWLLGELRYNLKAGLDDYEKELEKKEKEKMEGGDAE